MAPPYACYDEDTVHGRKILVLTAVEETENLELRVSHSKIEYIDEAEASKLRAQLRRSRKQIGERNLVGKT